MYILLEGLYLLTTSLLLQVLAVVVQHHLLSLVFRID